MAGAQKPASPAPMDVLIIGAGESGIAMGCQLRAKLACTNFRIYDRQSGVGGTWHINTYPGVACDIPAVFYSFSFAMNPRWSSFCPPGPEMKKYLIGVCEKFGISEKVQCDTDVAVCRWREHLGLWEVELRYMAKGMGDLSLKERDRMIREKGEDAVVVRKETVYAKVVCSCVGGLVEPRAFPENTPGMEDFKGPIFHSARWDHSVDFNDKNVVVVGTGCSAAQFVPRLSKAPYNAKKVTQLMRSPPWVVPHHIPPGGEEWWSKNGPIILTYVPGAQRLLRFAIFLITESKWKWLGGTEYAAQGRKKLERSLLKHMERNVPEQYHEILTPDYGLGCKRRIFDATWFSGLKNDSLELSTLPLTHVHESSVTLGPGRTYPDPHDTSSTVGTDARVVPTDIIVLANGFDTTRWLHPIEVRGRSGNDLVAEMEARGGAQAYQGTAMDGFPNFFMIFGPNTATGHSSVILATENMVLYSLKFIKLILAGEAKTVEVKHAAEVEYTRDLHEALGKTVFMQGGCQSYYFTKDGWNSTIYAYSQWHFMWRCLVPKWRDWDVRYTRKGVMMRWLRVLGRTAICAAALVWAYNMGRGKGKRREVWATGKEALMRAKALLLR